MRALGTRMGKGTRHDCTRGVQRQTDCRLLWPVGDHINSGLLYCTEFTVYSELLAVYQREMIILDSLQYLRR